MRTSFACACVWSCGIQTKETCLGIAIEAGDHELVMCLAEEFGASTDQTDLVRPLGRGWAVTSITLDGVGVLGFL